MKARVLLALLTITLTAACSTQSLTTAPDKPSLDGTGTIGSGH